MPCPGHALTQLPAAHVIELYAEEQGGHDVNDGEDNPERRVPFAKHLPGATQDRAEEALQQAAPLARPPPAEPGCCSARPGKAPWEGAGSLLQEVERGYVHVRVRARAPVLQGEQSGAGPHHTQHRKEDDDGQAGVGTVGTGVDVRVPLLVEFQHAQPGDHVHERRV